MILSLNECRKESMQREHSLITLQKLINNINDKNLEGSLVECGVWRGGTSMWMANCQKKYNMNRNIYLYDTFNGMTIPDDNDIEINSNLNAKDIMDRVKCQAGLHVVKSNMNKTKYDNNKIKYIEGDILQTLNLEENIPDKIALLRLDTDFYKSTKKEFEILYPKVVKNGYIIVDDYFYWKGSQKATDEFLLLHSNQVEKIHNNNGTRLVLQKLN